MQVTRDVSVPFPWNLCDGGAHPVSGRKTRQLSRYDSWREGSDLASTRDIIPLIGCNLDTLQDRACAMKSFQSFRLDSANQCLWRGDERAQITPKAFDVLRYMVENAGRLVTQAELLEALWPETYVNQEVLRKYILEIRKVLGDRPEKPEFIETVTKRGYRFIAPVADVSPDEPQDSSKSEMKSAVAPTEHAVVEEQVASETSASEQQPSSGERGVRNLAIILLLALVAAAAAGLSGYFWFTRNRLNARSTNNTSIAVLPFVDLSPAKDQTYFSDGFAEQLINDLAQVSGLKVVGRSSSFQFRGKDVDLRDVGRKLGVANVLEGSVRREGNHVRVTAELVKAADGFQLWSQTYDREINDILAVQDEIALAAAGALQLKLLGSSGQPVSSTLRSDNPEAYQAYLQGKYFAARGQDKEDLNKALMYADQAIKLDANYAAAWAQRSQVLETMSGLGLIESNEGFRKARESAEKAIALDPNLAAGYLRLARIQMNHDWDWDGAEVSLRKAAMLEPGSAEVFHGRAYLARRLGRTDEAIELYKLAVALDPLRANFQLALGYELFYQGRYDEALAALQKAEEMNPHLSGLYVTRGKVLFSEGRNEEALAETEKEKGEGERLSGEALAYYAQGRTEDSDKALKQLIATHQNDSAFQIGEIYAYRGEIDKAFEWLERAYRQRDPGTPEMKTSPLMKSLLPDPRRAELLKKMRLPA
jgi:TolB-like protein/DNA-binding winged helix-turn-helix (wHTH) protein/Flp pilus assembly protein TadD